MASTRKFINLLCLSLFLAVSCVSTHKLPAIKQTSIEAKQWSKLDGVVHYSDWKPYAVTTIGGLKGFRQVSHGSQTIYGGDPERKFKSTGFYYTIRQANRWWIVDPAGNASYNVAVNGVRPGNSARNEKSLQTKFGSEEAWITETHKDLEALGFNGTACWSEVPLIKYSNRKCSTPLCYTTILGLWSGYVKQMKKEHAKEITFSVFDTAFEAYVDNQAGKLSETRDDPALLGYFSDNELSFSPGILEDFLSLNDDQNPNYKAAKSWMARQGFTREAITDYQRTMFLGVVAEKYYKVVSEAIKKHDPNHLYLGSRLHGKPKHNQHIVAAAGKYCDIISINYYGQWEPSVKHFTEWSKWADKPVIITEFYAKGDDSGLPNISGAGWRVKTQDDRGVFYENFCLKLLQMKNCVGWNWFRYMDNDPTDTTADESNNDSNKGIVNNFYEYYQPLTTRMKELNDNKYNLIRYFDKSP
ncbi:MAG: agarase [Bacteroidales bacterium]